MCTELKPSLTLQHPNPQPRPKVLAVRHLKYKRYSTRKPLPYTRLYWNAIIQKDPKRVKWQELKRVKRSSRLEIGFWTLTGSKLETHLNQVEKLVVRRWTRINVNLKKRTAWGRQTWAMTKHSQTYKRCKATIADEQLAFNNYNCLFIFSPATWITLRLWLIKALQYLKYKDIRFKIWVSQEAEGNQGYAWRGQRAGYISSPMNEKIPNVLNQIYQVI